MGSEAPSKRASPSIEDNPPAKRQRTESSSVATALAESPVASFGAKKVEPQQSEYHIARSGLRRAIALALDHVGFNSATEEAMESFTHMTETYITSLMEDVQSMASHARRTQAIPTDFEFTLRHFNLDVAQLKKHRKPPIPQERIIGTKSEEHTAEDNTFGDLPCLDKELSGQAEKDAKSYIPKYLPAFPSLHTYKYTATDVESVTVRTGVHEVNGGGKEGAAPDWRGDPKKIREAAAVQAKQAEEALRKLVRASKMASLKELRSIAERNPISKERYDLWEEAMKDMLQDKGLSNGRDDAAREDVADHSMIVNAQKKYHRREIPRSAKRMGDALSGQ